MIGPVLAAPPGGKILEVSTRREGPTGPGDDQTHPAVLLGPAEGIVNLALRLAAERIHHFRPVQGDEANAALHFVGDIAIVHNH